ncbi:PLP-dependent aminotransferase family protein [Pseudoclavibacter alba]|uniref:PLP-dependent aminotransferase family protein n=1 Tax=Pseudoclavibacter albus TaxID=272241 RepID=A0ABT2HUR4_9MICO|nr:PLP-dependent aminotransferase family protein [Pseudoclavibacter alba]MCT2042059.1 PLP-dependent aminotransferase family protein [Pseudoclavibacter alba]
MLVTNNAARGPETGRNLDPWYSSYADRTKGLAASEVRALFAVASRPEVVSLAGGSPFVKALPEELIDSAFRSMMREHGPEALQYGGGQGIPQIREQILDIMALEGITDASADDIVTTTGSQHGLDIVSKLFLNPGDVVLAESPSYVGAIGTFRAYEADTVHVEMDEHGLIPSALEETLHRLRSECRVVKFLYTIPNFNNPAGSMMTAERRHEILEVCRREHLLIVEDNPYGLLYYDEQPPHAIRSLDSENVVYLGSFSKILSPGVRVGYVLAPHAIREKMILAVESSILSPSTFNQWLVNEYLKQADWKAQVAAYRDIYRERRDALDAALREHFPQFVWEKPNGGFFIWLQLPEQLDAKQMLPRAVKELVAYTPGTAFYADGRGQHAMRLAFCTETPERLATGVRRLATVINGELDLLETFGGLPMRSRPESGVIMPPPDIN